MAEVVEKQLRDTTRAWSVNNDDNSVEAGTVNDGSDRFKRRKDRKLPCTNSQRLIVQQADSDMERSFRGRALSTHLLPGKAHAISCGVEALSCHVSTGAAMWSLLSAIHRQIVAD